MFTSLLAYNVELLVPQDSTGHIEIYFPDQSMFTSLLAYIVELLVPQDSTGHLEIYFPDHLCSLHY